MLRPTLHGNGIPYESISFQDADIFKVGIIPLLAAGGAGVGVVVLVSSHPAPDVGSLGLSCHNLDSLRDVLRRGSNGAMPPAHEPYLHVLTNAILFCLPWVPRIFVTKEFVHHLC